MKHASLFSGIGGFDLAADWMGWENIFHCEINSFNKKVLKYYWPNAVSYDDITKTDFIIHRGTIDVLTGGFPCQPFSVAGKRHGTEDNRYLWPEMLRAIREIQPSWVVGENVRGIVNWSGGLVFHEVQAELEAKGYEVQPFILPACAKNAPHRRDRVWFVAYSNSCRNNRAKGSKESIWQYENKEQQRSGGTMQINGLGNERIVANTECNGVQQNETATLCNRNRNDKEQTHFGENFTSRIGTAVEPFDWAEWPTQSPIRSGNDGISDRLDGITFSKWRSESIKAYGNAVVPQVVLEIFKVIDKMTNKI